MNFNRIKSFIKSYIAVFKHLRTGILMIFAFYATNIFAQDMSPEPIKQDTLGFIQVSGFVEKNNKPLENTSIVVYKNNKKIVHLRTPPTGKFSLKLDYNKYYKVEITKMGMVTKKFEFDTQLPAGINKAAIFPFDFTIVLFPKYNYIDMSILDKPLAIIKYDKKYEDFFYDYNYAKTINDKVVYIQNKIEELTKEYAKDVDEGRQLYDKKDYRPALAKFERAHDIFPDEPFPIEKIALIKKILNEKKSKREIYNQIIADAESKVKADEYDDAIELLGQAMHVLPSEKYPAQRIKEIRKLIDQFARKEELYRQAIEKGELAANYNRYQEAIKSFTDASNLFPNRSYPKDKIAELNKIIGTQPENLASYSDNISKADKLFAEKNYKGAMQLYNLASKQQPDDKYSKGKISEISTISSNIARTDEEYNKALTEAAINFNIKNYEKAKTYFKMAANLKPQEKAPKSKLSQIDSLMTFAEDNEKQFNQLISDANDAYKTKNYTEAKKLYQKASDIKPYDIATKDKIIGLNTVIKQQADSKVKYDQAIKQAEKLYKSQNYDDAKQFYQAAGNILPEESYPLEQIVSINQSTNNNDGLQQNYKSIIEKADKLFKSANYEKALANYQLAQKIMPTEKHPQQQIDQINKLKLANLTTQDKYLKAINDGDKFLTDNKLQEATDAYNSALAFKPDEQYPKERIDLINKKLADLNNTDELYAQTITDGEQLLTDKKYQEAKNAFVKATKLKPTEKLPKEKIGEINKILNQILTQKSLYDKMVYNADRFFYSKDFINSKSKYEEASLMFPDEQYPKDRLKEIEKLMAAKDYKEKAYTFSIKMGDSLLAKQLYTDALTYYKQALDLKPTEIYPNNKILEIYKFTSDTKTKEELYSRTLAEADRKFNAKDYDRAIDMYKSALTIKPDEKYPNEQLVKINSILSENTKIETQYAKLLSDADRYLKDKDFINAKIAFKDALDIKPDEQYPKEKISEIEKIILNEKNKVEMYWKIIEDADEDMDLQEYKKAKDLYLEASTILSGDEYTKYPKEKIDEINKIFLTKQTINESYNKMLLVADRVLSSKDYERAKELYQRASEIKPEEKYPKDKLTEIEKIIKGFEAHKQLYSSTILKADDLYELKQYKEARDLYKKARELYPIQKYPNLRIAEINDLLRAEEYAKAIGDINKELIEKRTEKKFTFTPITDKKGNNYVLIEAKNLSHKPYKVLVYYGKDDERSGGLVFDAKEHDKVEKYVVRVGAQENWFKRQNNWISIQPLGGDLEVYSIQILQGN